MSYRGRAATPRTASVPQRRRALLDRERAVHALLAVGVDVAIEGVRTGLEVDLERVGVAAARDLQLEPRVLAFEDEGVQASLALHLEVRDAGRGAHVGGLEVEVPGGDVD